MEDTNATYTDGKWEFNESVTACFDNMLERSIPQYELMRNSVVNLAYDITHQESYTKSSLNILDIGCSNGIMIERLLNKFGEDVKYLGIDISKPMLDSAKHRLIDPIIEHIVTLQECDLRNNFPSGVFDIITSVLSIQFTPIEYRQKILTNIYKSLSPKDGCFIMVEKVLGNTSDINQLMVKNYYDMKASNGYTEEQIERKRLSLEGVLVPVTNDWNIDLLKQAGFRQVDVFWRWMNFVGYIAIK